MKFAYQMVPFPWAFVIPGRILNANSLQPFSASFFGVFPYYFLLVHKGNSSSLSSVSASSCHMTAKCAYPPPYTSKGMQVGTSTMIPDFVKGPPHLLCVLKEETSFVQELAWKLMCSLRCILERHTYPVHPFERTTFAAGHIWNKTALE